MKNEVIYLFLFVLFFSSCSSKQGKVIDTLKKNIESKITDSDGNVYTSVDIGKQVWLVENLKAIHYSNGDPIINIADDSKWCSSIAGAYCDYKNKPDNSQTQGRLYNWYAASDSRNIAPKGWHVATKEDWKILSEFLGNENAGGKLKQVGGDWIKPNSGATNETGFTALPGYRREYGGEFSSDYGYGATFWTSSEKDEKNAFEIDLNYSYSYLRPMPNEKYTGLNIRCVKN